MKRTFNPEFLNRLDEIIIFNVAVGRGPDADPRTAGAAAELRTSRTRRITISVTEDAKQWILEKTLGDRNYGARPLRRALQRYIEDPLSEALIQGTFTTRPAFIEVYLEGERLFYRQVGEGAENTTECCCTATRQSTFNNKAARKLAAFVLPALYFAPEMIPVCDHCPKTCWINGSTSLFRTSTGI